MNQIDTSEHQQENAAKRHQAFRLNIFFFATFFLFSILVIRLAYLQFIEGDELSARESQSVVASSPIAPIRGNIFDSADYPIAYTTSTQSLFYRIDPSRDQDKVIATVKRLTEIFVEYGDVSKQEQPLTAELIIEKMDVGYDLNKNRTKSPSMYSQPRRIKEGLSNEEIAYLLEHWDEFEGLEITEESVRNYDSNQIAVQLVGYLRPYRTINDNSAAYLQNYLSENSEYLLDEYVGFDGLEYLYQDVLRGKNGKREYPVNSVNKIVGQVSISAPVKGNNLHLTLHKDVQLAAQKAISDHLELMNNATGTLAMGKNAASGYAVAMEVDTGNVIVMASMPDYDPNIWRGGISTNQWNQIQWRVPNGTIRERPSDLPADEIWRHPTSLVPPGSTLKPLTVLLGLNEGIIKANEKYVDKRTFYFGRNNSASVSNSNFASAGVIDAANAIRVSSNTYMAEMIANRMYFSQNMKEPVKLWDEYMKAFGLGVATGSGLPGENRGDPYYFDTAERYSPQSALILGSFGQQARYTTLQLAQFTATLANHGKRMKPQFVQKITTYDGEVVSNIEPEVLSEIEIPEEHWKVIELGMKDVFVSGFEGVSYSFLRKTGTSQSDIAGKKPENAVFIAYAPAENPKLAVAVVVPEGGYGAWGAAPIARKVFDAYDKYIGLYGTPKNDKVDSTTGSTNESTDEAADE